MPVANMLTALTQPDAQNPLIPSAPVNRLQQLRDVYRGGDPRTTGWKGHVHVVASRQGDDEPVKVHGVYADEQQAKSVHRTILKQVEANGDLHGPFLQVVDVGGRQKPEKLSLVTETHRQGPVTLSAHESHAEAKGSAEAHARLFWNNGHQSTPDELSAGWVHKNRSAWNAKHPEHEVDRDFDFVQPDNVPRNVRQEHEALYKAEFDRLEDFPGLRKANAKQNAFSNLSSESRSGVFNVQRMAVS